MKIKDLIKKQTTIIAIAVVLVAIAAISVSYAIFFDVKENKVNQVITAGTLQLKLTKATEGTLTLNEPMSDEAALANTNNKINYTVENKDSNLPAKYTIYIYADDGNDIPSNNIKYALYNSGSSVPQSGTLLSSIEGTQLSEKANTTFYKIDEGTIGKETSAQTKELKVWIAEDTVNDDLEGTLNLSLYIVSEVDEEQALPKN